jgi:steroid 5-alpha reductase family enzyme
VTGTTAAFVGLGGILTTLTLVWMISVRLRDASVADICWGLCFVLLAWVYCFLSPTLTPRSWLVAALITLSGTRLSAHILHRHHGPDASYSRGRVNGINAGWEPGLTRYFGCNKISASVSRQIVSEPGRTQA